jgi:hypothetical protein
MSTRSDDKWISKFQLICKPEQSGKTFIMIQHIISDLTEPIYNIESINIIFCDNNLLLTNQTGARLEDSLNEYTLNGTPYIELSSHSRAQAHDSDAVFTAIVAKGVRNIVCCTNGRRMDDLYDLITNLSCKFTKDKFNVDIWLDEADKYISFIESTLRPIVAVNDNVYIHLITATPEPLFKKYNEVNVFPIENTTSKDYNGWVDNKIHSMEKKSTIYDFIANCLSENSNHLLPGTKWFIPGLSVKKTHTIIKKICILNGMAVICVNGDGITITIPSNPIHKTNRSKITKLSAKNSQIRCYFWKWSKNASMRSRVHNVEEFKYHKDETINEIISKVYKQHNLKNYAVAITGHTCIGRGISIISNDFMIDYAIYSHYSTKTEGSQLAGRVKGNIKGFSNYKPINIYTTNDFNTMAIEMEQKSRQLAQTAYQKQQSGTTTILDKTDYKTCDKSYEYIVHPELFRSFTAAKEFLKSKSREMGTKVNVTEPKNSVLHKTPSGHYVTSKLVAIAMITNDDIITIEKAKTIAPGTNISSTDKGSRYLILPVYESIASPPNSDQYQVRYLRFK